MSMVMLTLKNDGKCKMKIVMNKRYTSIFWNQLDLGWQSAFNLAWNAYMENTIPIGAVIQNEEGIVVSSAQNLIYSATGTFPQIYDHKLAHAEINSILQLKESEHPNIRKYTLTTTMEPCLLCFGAIVMGNIRQLRYAASDKYAGATAVNNYLDYVISKNIKIEGSFPLLEQVQIAMQTYYELEKNPYNCECILMEWEKDCSTGVRLGRDLFKGQVLQTYKEKRVTMSEVFDNIVNKQWRR